MKADSRPMAVCVDAEATLFPTPLLCQLLGTAELPSPVHLENDAVKAYELGLETKYYSAGVWLATLRARDLTSERLAESAEAVVLHFDGATTAAAESWLPFLDSWAPSVRILTCHSLHSTAKEAVNAWATKHNFELVELDPSDEDKEAAEEWNEAVGPGRILQILKAHTWSNLELKDGPDHSARLQAYLDGEKEEEAAPLASTSDGGGGAADDTLTSLFRGAVGSDGAEEVGFEELFAGLASLKAQGAGLDGEERRRHAEKVTMAFWKAVGGDEDELSDLDEA